MSRRFLCLIVVLICFLATPVHAILESELDFIVGSGSNFAGLTLDWNDGKDSLSWGYRWDGIRTAEEMLLDVSEADDRLYAKIETGGLFGTALYGIGYDRDNDGFGTTNSDVFVNGISDVAGPTEPNGPSDADDSYMEGWITGFWPLYLNFPNDWQGVGNPPAPGAPGGNPYGGGSWNSSGYGITDTVLQDGTWAGLSFAPGFSSSDPSDGVAAQPPESSGNGVPEPSTAMLIIGSFGLTLVRRQRKFAA